VSGANAIVPTRSNIAVVASARRVFVSISELASTIDVTTTASHAQTAMP